MTLREALNLHKEDKENKKKEDYYTTVLNTQKIKNENNKITDVMVECSNGETYHHTEIA